VVRPGDVSRPDDLTAGAPADIDVTQVARDAARCGRTLRALSGPVRRRPDALGDGTGVSAAGRPETAHPAAHGAPCASGITAAEVRAGRIGSS
jgi:hypothetical protein